MDYDKKGVGAGGSQLNVKKSINNDLIIDEFHLNNYTVMIMSLDHINEFLKENNLDEVDGVIGADILTSGKAIIDYDNLILYLANK